MQYHVFNLLSKGVVVVVFDQNVDQLLELSNGYSKNTGFFIPGTYFKELINYPSINGFYQEAYNSYSRSFKVNSFYENTYLSFNLWCESIYYCRRITSDYWPNSECLRLALLNITFESPSGSLKITNDNHLMRSMFLMEVVNDGLIQLYPRVGTTISIEPYTSFYGIPEIYLNLPNKTYFRIGKTAIISSFTLFTIDLLVIIVTLFLIFYFKSKKIINYFGSSFLLVSLLSFLIGIVVLISYYIDANGLYVCYIQITLDEFATALFLSALSTKLIKINDFCKRVTIKRVIIYLV